MLMKTDENYIRSILKRRSKDAHKGDFGKVLVFAGSEGMAGAAVLCSGAALRTGAGLVRCLVRSFAENIYPILQISVPEATCRAYCEGTDYNEYSAIAAGPGLGTNALARDILTDIICHYCGTLVLDADALNMISASDDMRRHLLNRSGTSVLTPHVGEARRLLGEDCSIRTQRQREEAVRKLADMYGSVVLLKGADTLVCDAGSEDIYMNTSGNPGMATGGSGDVLTGMIAALASQGLNPLNSARAGAFIHGLAGDMAADALGEMGLISSDIVRFVPLVLKKYYPES